MELIIGLIVIAVVGYFVFFRNEKKSTSTTTSAPYKVEQPVPAADIAPQPVAVEGAGQVVIPTIPTDIENRIWEQSLANLEKEKAEAVKEETPAKTPRKPRATKVGQTAAKTAKAADKKAAPKKAAAIKAKPKATKSKKT